MYTTMTAPLLPARPSPKQHAPPGASASASTLRLFLSSLLLLAPSPSSIVQAATIVVGDDPTAGFVGWTDGVCYSPLADLRVGDVLEFQYGPHDVYKMIDERSFFACDFSRGAEKLAGVGESPFRYTVTEEDAAEGTVRFACSVGSHCVGGNQKLLASVTADDADGGNAPPRDEVPRSTLLLGGDEENCALVQSGFDVPSDGDFLEQNALRSECTDPVIGDDGRYHVSCLSGPATLTPGGVINSARMLHYPYPKDRRVAVGQRSWEFVSGDPIPNGGGLGVVPVPINQLYVHHLSGRVILGQGTEGIRRSAPDAPFAEPYATLTGDEGELMIFHIIDLREVDRWLECVECRCRNNDGTYLDTGIGDRETGGVSCCTNCTSLEGPTVDYRMRYNVSYSDIPDDEPVTVLSMLTADISPAVGKNIEFDVPSFMFLEPNERSESDPHIQRLERVGPFNTLFKHDFFGADYHGPPTVRLLRCVGHLHIAAIGMWLEDAVTGETLCAGEGTHGTDPNQDKGFLTAIAVENYDVPKVIPADRPVRLITEYNATTLHTGVMGMWFVFISSERQITRREAALTVDVCKANVCDASLLPPPPTASDLEVPCEDALLSSPACTFGGLCDCETFVNSPESTGCGGMYASDFGDMPVNDLCAKYCGACGAPEDSATAAAVPPAETPCVDALADSPPCTFGGLCDCETFVNSPESTGCGGIYASDFGDMPVNSMCAEYCGACDADDADDSAAVAAAPPASTEKSKACEDTLPESPACRFGNLCDCAALAAAPQSTGCGGTYSTDMGDIVLNDVCANYCDACPDVSDDDVARKKIVEDIEDMLSEMCEYATDECRTMLSNLYTCAEGAPRTATLDRNVEWVLAERGRELAVEHSMLGASSLHADKSEELRQLDVLPCDDADDVTYGGAIPSGGEDGGEEPKGDDGADGGALPSDEDEETPSSGEDGQGETENDNDADVLEDVEGGDDGEMAAEARSQDGEKSGGANTGAIVGGVLGGVAVVLIGGLWYANGRKKANASEEEGKRRRSTSHLGGTHHMDNFESDHNV